MSFLIFDVDHSLASIGGDQAAEKIASIAPIKVTNGSSQVKEVLADLFIKKDLEIKHPLLKKSVISTFYEKSELAKSHKLNGIVIDTISHLFRSDMRLLEKKNRSERLEMQDWGKLDREYNTLISSLVKLPVWVVVNSHLTYDKNELGQFIFHPQLKGSTKDYIGEYFDCILFTRISTTGGRIQYLWQTKPDNQRYAKDRLDVLEQYIPQDFNIILQRYKDKCIEHPKVLIIGESGAGKTRALLTLNSIGDKFGLGGNGKLSTRFIN